MTINLNADAERISDTEFETAISGIRANFVESLLQRSIELENIRVVLEREGATSGLLLKVADIAHKLAGVASTFGYHAMGKTALAIDQDLQEKNCPAEPQALWRSNRDQVELLLDLMEEAMGEAD